MDIKLYFDGNISAEIQAAFARWCLENNDFSRQRFFREMVTRGIADFLKSKEEA